MAKFIGDSYESEVLEFLKEYEKSKDYGDEYTTTLLLKIYDSVPDVPEAEALW